MFTQKYKTHHFYTQNSSHFKYKTRRFKWKIINRLTINVKNNQSSYENNDDSLFFQKTLFFHHCLFLPRMWDSAHAVWTGRLARYSASMAFTCETHRFWNSPFLKIQKSLVLKRKNLSFWNAQLTHPRVRRRDGLHALYAAKRKQHRFCRGGRPVLDRFCRGGRPVFCRGGHPVLAGRLASRRERLRVVRKAVQSSSF